MYKQTQNNNNPRDPYVHRCDELRLSSVTTSQNLFFSLEASLARLLKQVSVFLSDFPLCTQSPKKNASPRILVVIIMIQEKKIINFSERIVRRPYTYHVKLMFFFSESTKYNNLNFLSTKYD